VSADRVTEVLERREGSTLEGSFRRAMGIAVALHVAVAIAAYALPRLTAKPPHPIDYVAVTIVPAAKLGVEKPPPPKPEPEPEKTPEPEPKPPEPKPEKKPATTPAATKKAPEKKAESKPAPPPEAGSETGSPGGIALGAPVARLDSPDFTYGYYVDQMLAQISRNWSRPPVKGGIEAWIHYRIQRDGTITDPEILRSSGYESFDLAAMRAVLTSSPLPPLPSGFREPFLGVNLIVR